MEIESLAMY